ncbi:DUF192 domain-containing protein [uncultured Winogradskyella sp.]|uniref:DUF192 domain-containing protein n=1 Tax=uncultured Winogradskyella sp. TaxID=395353 RepID=UPI002636F59F|nr:DUF192 domain-containing protein [uncultured Winogradskyella sp.]
MRLQLFSKYLILIVGLVVFSSCKEEKAIKRQEKVVVNFKKEGVLTIKKTDSDSIIKTLDIEIADNEYETQTGLMYRTKLKTNHGMLFIFPDEDFRSFYMKNTKIPLDIIYIDTNKTIVSVQKDAQPFDETSLPSDSPAKYVLEINSGLFDEWQIKVGDIIEFSKIN